MWAQRLAIVNGGFVVRRVVVGNVGTETVLTEVVR